MGSLDKAWDLRTPPLSAGSDDEVLDLVHRIRAMALADQRIARLLDELDARLPAGQSRSADRSPLPQGHQPETAQG